MGVNSDFRELFSDFSDAEVRYMIVGGYAVIHHTEPRYTKDIDLWVEPTADNGARVLAALTRFGAPTDRLTLDDLTNPDLIYQIGIEPNRIDILMGIQGLQFSDAFERSVETTYGDVAIRVLGLEDLLRAKRTAGRDQDLLDAKRLEDVLNRR